MYIADSNQKQLKNFNTNLAHSYRCKRRSVVFIILICIQSFQLCLVSSYVMALTMLAQNLVKYEIQRSYFHEYTNQINNKTSLKYGLYVVQNSIWHKDGSKANEWMFKRPIFMTGLYSVQSIVYTIVLVDLSWDPPNSLRSKPRTEYIRKRYQNLALNRVHVRVGASVL